MNETITNVTLNARLAHRILATTFLSSLLIVGLLYLSATSTQSDPVMGGLGEAYLLILVAAPLFIIGSIGTGISVLIRTICRRAKWRDYILLALILASYASIAYAYFVLEMFDLK